MGFEHLILQAAWGIVGAQPVEARIGCLEPTSVAYITMKQAIGHLFSRLIPYSVPLLVPGWSSIPIFLYPLKLLRLRRFCSVTQPSAFDSVVQPLHRPLYFSRAKLQLGQSLSYSGLVHP